MVDRIGQSQGIDREGSNPPFELQKPVPQGRLLGVVQALVEVDNKKIQIARRLGIDISDAEGYLDRLKVLYFQTGRDPLVLAVHAAYFNNQFDTGNITSFEGDVLTSKTLKLLNVDGVWDVWKLTADGYSANRIGTELAMSASKVQYLQQRIYTGLRVNRYGAVVMALRIQEFLEKEEPRIS